MENIKKIYASYGSNMNYAQMRVRCPAAVVLGKGILKEHLLVFRGVGKGLGTLIECKDHFVPIVLWVITDLCEVALDVYEEYPLVYDKTIIEVTTDEGLVKGMAYLMNPAFNQERAEPPADYLEGIREGYRDNGISLQSLEKAILLNKNE